MTSKRLFQYSLALPLIPPFLVLPLWFVRESINETSALIFMIIGFSGIVGGLPYLILAATLLLWMRDKDLAAIKRALLLSPLLMLPIFAVCLGMYIVLFERHPSLNEYVVGLCLYGAFVLIFGYFYVGLAFGLEKLYRIGWGVHEEF